MSCAFSSRSLLRTLSLTKVWECSRRRWQRLPNARERRSRTPSCAAADASSLEWQEGSGIMPVTAEALDLGFFLDGKWRTDGQRVEIYSPGTGQLVGITYRASAKDAEEAIAA